MTQNRPREEGDGAVSDQRFSQEHRLRKRSQYLRVYGEGRRVHGRLAVIFCYRREDDGPWRLGLTATRKTGGAVRRNRLRRCGREFFRLRGGFPSGWDFVLNFKQAATEAGAAELNRDLSQILGRLGFGERCNLKGDASPPC